MKFSNYRIITKLFIGNWNQIGNWKCKENVSCCSNCSNKFVHYSNNKDIDKDTFKSNVLMFILAGPQSQFTEDEFKHIKVSFQFIHGHFYLLRIYF